MDRITPNFMMAIDILYDVNTAMVSNAGTQGRRFDIGAGVRQGCPLSPLIFAIAADLLLRKLGNTKDVDAVKAFADDTAIIVKNLGTALGPVAGIFEEYRKISGLELNIPKTVVIPLWNESLETIKGSVLHICPNWGNAKIQRFGKHLGFWLGPEGRGKNWKDPFDKYKLRLASWSQLTAGMFYAITAHRAFCASVLCFVAQLEQPSQDTIQAYNRTLSKVAKGPGNWIQHRDLFHFNQLGFPKAVVSLA